MIYRHLSIFAEFFKSKQIINLPPTKDRWIVLVDGFSIWCFPDNNIVKLEAFVFGDI